MSKPEWGTKRICQSCGAKYYDLQSDSLTCPSCGTAFDPEALLKSRRVRTTAPVKAPKVEEKPVEEDELAADVGGDFPDVDDDVDADDNDTTLLADDDMDDDDDLADVVIEKEDDQN